MRSALTIACIDERQRRDGRYLLAAMVVEHAATGLVRKALREAAPGHGIRRRYIAKEKDSERKQLLAIYRELPGVTVTVDVVDLRIGRPVAQRAHALGHLMPRLLGAGIDRLVFDHVDVADARRDRQALIHLTRGRPIAYGHEPPHSGEPMLWVPDAAAWCAGRPGWRSELDGWAAVVTL
jgi:hypothetical protein